MSSLLVTGISELWTVDASRGSDGVLTDAAVVLDGERVAWVGERTDAPAADDRLDVGGRAVLPGWVDSHTHLVFAGDRSSEFEARMAGRPYEAGGIGVTVEATRATSIGTLTGLVVERVREAQAGGTTTLETKTGYGLDVDSEVAAAQLAAGLVEDGLLDAVTYLGAHLVPAEAASADDYVDLVSGPMLDAVRPYVQWADVFCEAGAFTVEQSRHVLQACAAAGLGLRVHGNQLGESGGVALAVELGAASVDHCNHLSGADVDALAGSHTVATLLPACDLSTRAPLAPARRLIDAGATIALASNCNPGTSYTSSMAFCVATAVLQQGLSLDEAITAATLGGARALRRDVESAGSGGLPDGTRTGATLPVGSIAPGARADLHVLDAPAAIHLAYRPGMPLTWATIRRGRLVHHKEKH